VDGPSGLLNRDPAAARKPSLFSLGEYGPNVGVPRLLEVLAAHRIAATFFVPGWVAERYPRAVDAIVAAGHEVGHHGYLHEPPASLSEEEEAAVLDRGSRILASVAGAPPVGYRSPAWELSEHSLRLLSERGFLYDSSLMGDDALSFVGPPAQQVVEIPVHWALDDYPYFGFSPLDLRRPPANPQQVLDTWTAAFDEVRARGQPFVLTMHPYLIGRPGRLAMLERLIAHIRRGGPARFTRCADHALAFRQQGTAVSGPRPGA
jgi:peptidoglycan/xylan/chitin deacetylase (PgdA/CDA1 family)